MVALPITAAATLTTAWLVTRYTGEARYGFVALLGATFQLLAFADLGLGAGVVNAVATRDTRPDGVRRALATTARTIRALGCVALVLLVVTWLGAVLRWWAPLLGVPADLAGNASLFVALALTPFLISLPLGVGARILVGLGRNAEVAILAIAGPVVAVVLTAALIGLKANPLALAVAQSTGVLAVAAITMWRSLRRWGVGAGELLAYPAAGSDQLINTAAPFLVISICMPIAMQSDRLVLAHVSTPAELASHALAMQFYTPVFSVVSVAAVALWPMYRAHPEQAARLWRNSLIILGGSGIVVGALFAVCAGPMGRFISGDRVTVGPLLALAFALLILVGAVHQPSGMLLTTPQGLRVQAAATTAMLVVNLALSIILARRLGAAGPVLASAISMAVCQVGPCLFWARHVLATNEWVISPHPDDLDLVDEQTPG